MSADFLRLQQLAALLNISPREVQRLRDRGELRCAFLGRTVLVPRSEYERLRDRLNTEAGVAPALRPVYGRPRKVAQP